MNTELLEKKLRSLECPINWPLENINKGNTAKKLLRRSDSRSEQGDASSIFQEIALFLCVAYLEYYSSDGDKMKDRLKYVEELLGRRGEEYSFIKDYSPAVEIVTNAMWAHCYFKEKNIEEAEKYLNLVTPFDTLNTKWKAGIFAIKSSCFMAFGPHDSTNALQAIKKAVELDDDEAEWSFLNGKCLARTRRCLHYRSSPSDEELYCLKKAVDKGSRSSSHIVFCALSYQERGLNGQTPAKKSYLEESFALFKMAAAYSFDSPTSLARIARGLMRNLHPVTPPGVVSLVENCVRRSYQLCPDAGLVNHVAGNFYFKTGKSQMEKYLFHLKKAALECGVYGAYMNLFDMYNTHKKHIDVDLLANKFWEDFKEIPVDRFKALKTMVAYHFFIKKDNLKAIEFCKEWVASPENTDKNQRNTAFVKCENLSVALADKVRKVLEEDSSSLTPNQKEEMKTFLDAVDASSSRSKFRMSKNT